VIIEGVLSSEIYFGASRYISRAPRYALEVSWYILEL